MSAQQYYPGVGRRKQAIATARLSSGKGELLVNNKTIAEYFGGEKYEQIIKSPLVLLAKEKDCNVSLKVNGGGLKAQAEAARLAIARALLNLNEDYKVSLRREGYLTRDPRIKERKKPGLKKARKAPQFSKR